MPGLNKYLWSGHSALMGTVLGEWQDRKTVPDYFASELAKARKGYESFVEEGVAPGRRPALVGGGLVRSLGDWLRVVSMRRKGATISSNARILGGSDCVDRISSEAKEQEKETLRVASSEYTCASNRMPEEELKAVRIGSAFA
jgi:hypothetical protein